MKPSTKHGIFGAGVLIVIFLLLSCVPYDSAFYDSTHQIVIIVTYPVTAPWLAALKAFGVEGDQVMGFILPMFATIYLYLAALGYCLGALFGKVVETR